MSFWSNGWTIGIGAPVVVTAFTALTKRGRGWTGRVAAIFRRRSALRFVPIAGSFLWHWAVQPDGRPMMQWMGRYHVTNAGPVPNAPLSGALKYRHKPVSLAVHLQDFIPIAPGSFTVDEVNVQELRPNHTATMTLQGWTDETDEKPSGEITCMLKVTDRFERRRALRARFRET